jgi:GNAT superfamily N-acetyltransferase
MEILAAGPKDADACARLMRVFYEREPGLKTLDGAEVAARACLMLNAVDKGQADFLFLCSEGVLNGYALMTRYFSAEYSGMVALLDEYLILPEFQGKGMGGRFLTAIKGWAVEKGFARVMLEVTDKNARVVGLYERNGFTLLSRRLMAWVPDGLP